jgi:aspartyl-tRNA synthetase
MNKYGSDKPDLRFALELVSLNDIVKDIDFKLFKDTLTMENGAIKALILKDQADKYSRKKIDGLTELAKKHHASGLAFLKVNENQLSGSISKFFDEKQGNDFINELNLANNDLVLIVSGEWKKTCESLGALRNELGKELDLISANDYQFCWVVDWPLFEYDADEKRYYAAHHPFTRPAEDQLDSFDTNPIDAMAQAYDIVLNGYEIGGGSLRIYKEEMQERMFKVLGLSEAEIQEKFGFFINAFKYGTPPHGGIALGLDRIAMILSNSSSIRDVIAFPKNASATCPLTKAPQQIADEQLKELGINYGSGK